MNPTETPSAARPGEVWELPLAGAGLLGWVVVRRHPDDPGLVLVVPADTEPDLGDGDLVAPLTWSAAAGPDVDQRCVLRPDYGGWLAAADLWFRLPGARVPAAWRDELLAGRLALARGQDRAVDLRGPASADLQAWRAEHLAPALAGLEAWRDRRRTRAELRVPLDDAGDGPIAAGPDVAIAEQAPAWPPGPSDPDIGDLSIPLAAAGSDALDDVLAAHGDDEPPPPELLRELVGGLEGRPTLLRLTPAEVQLEVDGPTEPPRCLFLGPAGGRAFLRWTRVLAGGWRSQPVDLAALAAPPLRLVIEGERVHDLELDPDLPAAP